MGTIEQIVTIVSGIIGVREATLTHTLAELVTKRRPPTTNRKLEARMSAVTIEKTVLTSRDIIVENSQNDSKANGLTFTQSAAQKRLIMNVLLHTTTSTC
jgi:hypothetical protein